MLGYLPRDVVVVSASSFTSCRTYPSPLASFTQGFVSTRWLALLSHWSLAVDWLRCGFGLECTPREDGYRVDGLQGEDCPLGWVASVSQLADCLIFAIRGSCQLFGVDISVIMAFSSLWEATLLTLGSDGVLLSGLKLPVGTLPILSWFLREVEEERGQSGEVKETSRDGDCESSLRMTGNLDCQSLSCSVWIGKRTSGSRSWTRMKAHTWE